MGIRKHLTYANVAATLALAGVIGGGGAYAASQIGSNDLKNNSVRSVDLKNRKAVKARDVRRNALTGGEINERSLLARGFAPIAGAQGACDPEGVDVSTDCAVTPIKLARRGRLLVVATGDFYIPGDGAAAKLKCEITIDETPEAEANPGEQADNTALDATDGFAMTFVSDRLTRGRHNVALRCSQPVDADGKLASASIAVLGISG